MSLFVWENLGLEGLRNLSKMPQPDHLLTQPNSTPSLPSLLVSKFTHVFGVGDGRGHMLPSWKWEGSGQVQLLGSCPASAFRPTLCFLFPIPGLLQRHFFPVRCVWPGLAKLFFQRPESKYFQPYGPSAFSWQVLNSIYSLKVATDGT